LKYRRVKQDKFLNIITMKNAKLITKLAAIVMVALLFVRCSEDTPAPVVNYTITGNVTYPGFDGAAAAADGAIVYISADGSANPTATTVASASGNYVFAELPNGTYTVWANYDSQNTNNMDGRMMNVMFFGEGAAVTVENANATQAIALTSTGQAEAVTVNTNEGGDWSQDWNHSVVGFEFPYDEENAPYSGQFMTKEIFVNFNPSDLGSSVISAKIDLLTVYTASPGGRDPLWATNDTGYANELWTDVDGAYKLGCISGTFGVTTPDDTDRTATFTSTTIEAYGDGYLATGPMVFNGVTSDVDVFFQYIPGFDGTNRGGDPTRFSSFQASFEFAALDVFNIESSHVGGNNVTVNASFQISKAL
jgi:hypothetical protein